MEHAGEKCYIYTRVSTDMQVEGYSLDAQYDTAKRCADLEQMIVAGVYKEEGKSGKSIEGRPEFLRMFEDIKNRKDNVTFVIVFKLSRFGRNTADVLSSLEIMKEYGVNLISIEDKIDSSVYTGKFMLTILSAVAEMERDNILVQTMEGRKRKAREGLWNGGQAPYGYVLSKNLTPDLYETLEEGEEFVKSSKDSLATDIETRDVVRTIFDRYVHTTDGINGVVNYLNRQGIKKKITCKNDIDMFTTSFVRGVIDNPVYMGKIAYGRRKNEKIEGTKAEYHVVKNSTQPVLYKGLHKALITEEEWNKAHSKRLEEGGRCEKVHSLNHRYLLSAILVCPVCGKKMYGNVGRKKKQNKRKMSEEKLKSFSKSVTIDENGNEQIEYYKDYFYYHCKHSHELNGFRCTYKKQWKEEMVNDAVIEVVRKMVKDERFAEAIKGKIGSKVDVTSMMNEFEVCQKSLKKAENTRQRIQDQIDDLENDDAMYERKLADFSERLNRQYFEINDLEDEISSIKLRIENVEKQKLSTDKIYEYLLHFDKLYAFFKDEEKKEFLNTLIEEVQIYEAPLETGQFLKSIKFKFPVFYNGQDATEFGLTSEMNVETCCLLSRKA